MDQRLYEVLTGGEANYMLPFYWQHGDHTATIPKEVERIYRSGVRAFCVESRPHKDFCGPGWWRDMDIILDEAEKRGMKVWILDDDHFPTGHANGMIAKAHPELRKWQLAERHVDVMGPLNDALLLLEPTDQDHILLDVYAYPRLPADCDADNDGADAATANAIATDAPITANAVATDAPATANAIATDAPITANAIATDAPTTGNNVDAYAADAANAYIEPCLPEPLRLTDGAEGNFLRFSVPAGCWRIFFLYKTRRGTYMPEYIDMLNAESVRVLVDAVYEAHYQHYARYFGTTIAGFFSDEPLFGNSWSGPHEVDRGMYNHRIGMPGLALPWNDRIPDMMREALGTDPLPLLSALWFGLGEPTGPVRHAYMDAATRLYRDCFTRQLGDWCAAHGVQYIGHIIEDMNAHARLGCSGGHYFRSLDGQHMSGIDIVLHQLIPGIAHHVHTSNTFGNNADPAFFHYVLAKLAASFAHIGTDTNGRAMCEVFGAYGWAEGTPVMKWLLDHLLVRGVNHFVPHAFSPAFPDPDCPPHFGANDSDPQFEGFSRLMRYGNRAAHLLFGAVHVADAAILYHADAEWFNDDGDAMLTQVPAKILYDAHIDYDILPADCFTDGSGSRVFKAQAEAVPGEGGTAPMFGESCAPASGGGGSLPASGRALLRVGGETYRCLVVPYAKGLPAELDRALTALSAAGVPVIFMHKNESSSELLARVDNALGCRSVYVDGNYPLLRVYRCRSGASETVMFFNESTNSAVHTTVRLTGAELRTPLLLDLLNDRMFAVNAADDGSFCLQLAPYQSVILVTDAGTADLRALPASLALLPPMGTPETCLAASGLTFGVEAASWQALEQFTSVGDAVRAAELFNINGATHDPGFSGIVRYTAAFRFSRTAADNGAIGAGSTALPGNEANGAKLTARTNSEPDENELTAPLGTAVALDLGEVGQTAHLWLNGVDLGVRVCAPYRYELGAALREGTNDLVIEVANTLANAIRDSFSYLLPIPATGLIGPLRWCLHPEFAET